MHVGGLTTEYTEDTEQKTNELGDDNLLAVPPSFSVFSVCSVVLNFP